MARISSNRDNVLTFTRDRQPPKASEDHTPWNRTYVPRGDSIYREGEVCDRIHVVVSGVVKLVAYLPDGRARILGLQGPGSLLGTLTLLSPAPRHTHSAIALDPVETRWIPMRQLGTLRDTRESDYLELLDRQSQSLRRAERWIVDFCADTTPRRIARLVRHLALLRGTQTIQQVELLTCQETAEALGITTESASRTLARFKRTRVLTPAGLPRRYRYDALQIERLAFA